MTTFETVVYHKDDRVARVTLNRPRVLNAYNIRMRDELYQVLGAIRDDPDVGAVVLSGAGERAFCAGADLTEFGTAPSRTIARQVRWERDVWGLLISLPQLTIAALHGYVLGSGVEMALLCDMRIASQDAIFGLPEAALGMIPAAGGTQSLARVIGTSRALDMLLSGRRIDAWEAHRMGLVEQVVPRERLLDEAHFMALSVVSRNPECFRSLKSALTLGMDLPLTHALDLEARLALPLLAASQRETGRS